MNSQQGLRSRTRFKRIGIAVVVGLLATLGLNVLAFFVDKLGYSLLSRTLIWPNALLQNLVPLNNIGSAESPITEGSPLNFLAFIASIPLSWFVYSCLSYAWLFKRKRHID